MARSPSNEQYSLKRQLAFCLNKLKINGLAHRLITGVALVQAMAAVELSRELSRNGWIANPRNGRFAALRSRPNCSVSSGSTGRGSYGERGCFQAVQEEGGDVGV